MDFGTLSKLLAFVFWPVALMLIFYFLDKKKFITQLKSIFGRGKNGE
jgi:hypothetical protein